MNDERLKKRLGLHLKDKNVRVIKEEKVVKYNRVRYTTSNTRADSKFNIKGVKELTLNYPRYDKLVGILIVNLNNIELTKKCLESLDDQINKNYKIFLIDQNSNQPNTLEFLTECEKNKKISVIKNKENRPLNHIWNEFKHMCNAPYLCFLNNDTVLSNTFIDDTLKILDSEEKVGAVIHVTNNMKYVKSENTIKYEIFNKSLYQGWDFTVKRDLVPEIPKGMLIFGGDDYIFAKLNTLGYKVAIAYSSPIIHFKERTRVLIPNIGEIQKNDGMLFRKLVADEKLIQIDSTMNHGYCGKYPPKDIKLTQNKKCVYTAVIGDYDSISPTKFKKIDDWDYICFTDNLNMKSDFWRVVYINNDNVDGYVKNIKLARYFKTNFHEYLSSYDYILWIDARISAIKNMNNYLSELADNDILFLKHPQANSINDEFKRVLSGKIETLEMVNKLKEKYAKEGYNYDNGLISSGILMFRNNEKVVEFFRDWWNEIEHNSHRDQLSANYVIWKHKDLKYKIISGAIGKYFIQLPRNTKPFRFNK